MQHDNIRSTAGAGLLLGVAAMVGLTLPVDADAAEGASSNYFPGSYGNVAVAMAPDPGWIYQNYNIFYSAEVSRAVRQGRVYAEIDTFSYSNMSAFLYTFEKPVLGATFMMGAFVPLAYVDLDASLVGENASIAVSDSVTGLGDISIQPFSFYWNSSDWHFNFYNTIITPTGKYDVDEDVNIGLNHWSFDTVFALTYFNPETGFDFSAVTGYMFNLENDDTNYETGDEVHVDVMVNKFLSDTFALGISGYYYKQVSGDSGRGAILGDFEGDSYGVGPSLLWVPKTKKGNFSVTGSWLHDLDATRRLESDYLVLTLNWTFGK